MIFLLLRPCARIRGRRKLGTVARGTARSDHRMDARGTARSDQTMDARGTRKSRQGDWKDQKDGKTLLSLI
jgi:hypothetical protein